MYVCSNRHDAADLQGSSWEAGYIQNGHLAVEYNSTIAHQTDQVHSTPNKTIPNLGADICVGFFLFSRDHTMLATIFRQSNTNRGIINVVGLDALRDRSSPA